LRKSGLFRRVEPDFVVRIDAVPTDEAFVDGRLWGLRNTGQDGGRPGVDINVLPAWAITRGSSQVKVAIVDTGIRLSHADLAPNLWRNPAEIPGNGVDDDHNGWVDDIHGINTLSPGAPPEDDHGHGSHCAGIIGAFANRGGPMVGVAWEVGLMALKFISSEGYGYLSDALRCFEYAVRNGAAVINASWGGYFQSEIFDAAIRRAGEAGALVVAAAGNNARDISQVRFSPAGSNATNVLAVAAINRMGELAWFSNYSPSVVHLAAPGQHIFSTTAESDWAIARWSGTSMAAPYVSGAAALLKARFPTASVRELKQRLLMSTTLLAALQGRTISGGLLNVAAAMEAREDGNLEILCSPAQFPLPAGEVIPVFVTVSDLYPIGGASVQLRVGNAAWATLADSGVAPDVLAGDGVYSGMLQVPLVSGQVRVEVQASAAGKSPARADFVFPVMSRPPNDAFERRTPTGGGITRSYGTNRNATRELEEPIVLPGGGGKTVWWSWTSPASQMVTLSTAGSNFDTTLAVFKGN
ncbi:MAG: S8 family serine peptidase, partial [Chthoniobacterales bacterium]|nr:S8 family serine peptidase [Chthoniobacterales bacterium]